MNRLLKTVVLLTMTLTLFISTLSGFAMAEEISPEEAQLEKEMAEQLKFIFEEATETNFLGDIKSVDIELIEQEFGSSPELTLLASVMSKNLPLDPTPPDRFILEAPDNAKLDRCINNKILNGFKSTFSLSAIVTVIEYIKSGNYSLAAKRLIKLGVKGNAVGIGAQLIYWWGQCQYKVNGWA